MSARTRCSLLATLTGWSVATLLTLLFFELPELSRNAPPGDLLRDLIEGCSLWAGFTLLVCAGVWCVAILPLALILEAETIVRRRWLLACSSSAGAVLFIGWRLGTWRDLVRGGPGHPISSLFLCYTGFGFALAWVTTLLYARLLRS